MSAGENDDGAQLEFAWDLAKAASNLAKHGVAFAQGSTVFADALALTVFDNEHSESEERWFTLDMSSQQAARGVAHVHGRRSGQRTGEDDFGARGHAQRAPAVRG